MSVLKLHSEMTSAERIIPSGTCLFVLTIPNHNPSLSSSLVGSHCDKASNIDVCILRFRLNVESKTQGQAPRFEESNVKRLNIARRLGRLSASEIGIPYKV